MDFKSITDQAKKLFERRGGSQAAKEDAEELRDIAKGEGSLSDKAKAAADALKDPGAAGQEPGAARPETGAAGADSGAARPETGAAGADPGAARPQEEPRSP
jgi:hypothetical protein